MKLQLKNLKKNYLSAQKYFKKKKIKKFLCHNNNKYINWRKKNISTSSLGEIGKTLIFGVVVYSTEQLKKICQVFDNSIDAIFVDTEKKIPFLVGKNIKKNFIPTT